MTATTGKAVGLQNAFGRALRGRLRLNEPMSRHTVWGVGGVADRFYEPADVEDLGNFLAQQPQVQGLLFLGLGSNLLVRDGGLPGVVIATAGCLDGLAMIGPNAVRAEAGIPTAKLARFCAQRGLCGCEFMAGIPGTVGGALAMNAGAFGAETWDFVRTVETVDRRGRVRLRQAGEYRVGYRRVEGTGQEWFVSAELELAPGDSAAGLARIRDLMRRRGTDQPMGHRSCGSVFKNPPGDHAGRLIDISGLKGMAVGGAVVSEKHANFILNTGDATAGDIEALMEQVAEAVARLQGVHLDPEVRIVGRARPCEMDRTPGAGP